MDKKELIEALWIVGGIGFLALVIAGWYLYFRILRSVEKIDDILGYVKEQEEQATLNRL